VDAIITKPWDLKQIPTRSIKYIYRETPEHSPLRRLFADSMANLGNGSWFTEEEDWHRKRFLLDLAQAQFALSKGEKIVIMNFRDHCMAYHVPTTEQITKARTRWRTDSSLALGRKAMRWTICHDSEQAQSKFERNSRGSKV